MRFTALFLILLFLILMFECQPCGKEFQSKRGLSVHHKTCSKMRMSRKNTIKQLQAVCEAQKKPNSGKSKIRRKEDKQDMSNERWKRRDLLHKSVCDRFHLHSGQVHNRC